MNNAVETISRVLFLVILGNGILNLFAHFAVILLLRDSQYRSKKAMKTDQKHDLLRTEIVCTNKLHYLLAIDSSRSTKYWYQL